MPKRPQARRGQSLTLIVVAIVLLGLGAGILWWMVASTDADPERREADLYAVDRGDFEIVIPASGELVAQRQLEIKNRLDTTATITEIVDEGSVVRQGDVLVRFNDDEIRGEVQEDEDQAISAENDLESAVAELEILRQTRESEIEKAELAVEIAELELKSWENGDVVAQREELRLALETAELDHKRLVDRFEASKRLYEQEFISLDEFKQDEIALVESQATLRLARLAIEVFEEYEYEKQRKQLESDLDQARKELIRVISRQDAAVRRAESDVESRRRQLEIREQQLAESRRQLEMCTVRAPSAGLVVYASSLEDLGRWDDDETIQVGTEVRRNEYVMVLPDISRMAADVKISEAMLGRIEPGQFATVICDAAPDRIMHGVVQRIGVLAETGGWRDPNNRQYTVRIALDGENTLELKPSMRCMADIKIDHVDDAVHVPIQAVQREGAAAYVYVPDGPGYSQHEVSIGRASEMYVEITEGLAPGREVLLREPRPEEVVSTLPAEATRPVDRASDERVAEVSSRPGPDGSEAAGTPESGEAPIADPSVEAAQPASN